MLRSIQTTVVSLQSPTKLQELAGLEVKRRKLFRELIDVHLDMNRISGEIDELGIEIPWKSMRFKA